MALVDFDKPGPGPNLIQAWRLIPDGPDKPTLRAWLHKFMEPDEINLLQAEIFEALEIGPDTPVQPRVFDALRDKVPLPTAELAVLTQNRDYVHDCDDLYQLLLVPRPPHEPFYAGLLGLLGGFLLGLEKPDDGARRVLKKKLGVDAEHIVHFDRVDTRWKETPRNTEVGILYACVLDPLANVQLPPGAEWVLPSRLPHRSMMRHHAIMARDVAVYLWKRQREMLR